VGIYDWYLVLRHRFHDAKPPAHVAVVITERDLLEQGAYQTLSQFLNWAFEYAATRVTISVSVLDEAVVPTLAREFRDLTTPRSIVVRQPSNTEPADAPIQVNIGLGGKREFAAAVRQIAEAVDEGSIDPDTVDADTIEDRLVFADEPDLVIKTGAERLSDFLIWQSVYSELYFTDVNWRDFRRRDYVRAVIDYQNRQRRFGQ